MSIILRAIHVVHQNLFYLKYRNLKTINFNLCNEIELKRFK